VADFTLPRDDEQRVEEALVNYLRPARLALRHDVGVVLPGERGEPVGFRAGDVDEQIARRGDVRDIEDLVGEPGQGSLGECNQSHGHVDAHDRHRRVDPVLHDLQVALDVPAAADAVHDGGQPHRHIRRHLFLRASAHCVPLPPAGRGTSPVAPRRQSR
jgi:hypothetical protein